VANWYEAWATWLSGLLQFGRRLLPEVIKGQRVLDVACGHGRLSRELADLGGNVVGVDVSGELIKKAQTVAADQGSSPTYLCADIARVDDWWDGTPFDGAACEMALMDIADLDAVIRSVVTVLRPNGWFVASLVHPCFPGNPSGLSSWPPNGGYSNEGFWTSADHNPDGIRIRLGSCHRTLATYLNTLIRNGLRIEGLAEPRDTLPQFLAVGCRAS
jgi:2-polyprenyl-3-methyl-5-hydroxy-6-metoxy-1,4-benzoquinol methylase